MSRITIYDNLSRKNHNVFIEGHFPEKDIRFIHGDLLDTRKFTKALQTVDMVYHLAARASTPFSVEDPHALEQTNHWGTAELSYLVEESKTIQRVIYLSSTAVYAPSTELITDTTVPEPATHYGLSKLRGEKMLTRLKDRKIIVLRCGNVYGYSKSMRFDAFINKFVFEAHFQGNINIFGNGRQQRACIHVDELSQTLGRLLDEEVPSGVYNLCSQNYTVRHVAETVQRIYPKLETIFVNQDMAMKSLPVQPSAVFTDGSYFHSQSLENELQAFADRFAF